MRFSIDQNATENFWKEILPEINSNQILAIKNPYFLTNLSIFSSLQSINLNLQSSSIFHQFQYLIHLKQLSIQLSEIIIEEQTWLSSILFEFNSSQSSYDDVN
jgi:Ca2+-binding EF-hand superfamily protein